MLSAMNRIGDYALIGDCHSAALVGRDGSIDWVCFPRFDSRAVFCKILDAQRGGSFAVEPVGLRSTSRAYLGDTNVLLTRFECESGVLELTDCMPVAPLDPATPTKVTTCRSVLRRARCIEGTVDVAMTLTPRFEYGAFTPRFTLTSPTTVHIVGGADALIARATHPLQAGPDRATATWRLRAWEEAWIEVTWLPSFKLPDNPADPDKDMADQFRIRLDDTIAFWRAWMQNCWYEGEWSAAVRRSALALKALTYAPSGAVVAAPTTSLPEEIGGTRNWDYRFTWIRDATLTLASLFILGFAEEALAFKVWQERTGAGRPEDLQIMYRIDGERALPEIELTHLAGHRGSRPVRIGNAAVKQLQLDAYGQLLEGAYLWAKSGGELTEDNWRFLSGMADLVCERWRKPDQGIWEIRDEARHFVHSKLHCWMALDRAIKTAELLGLPGPIGQWAEERDELRRYLMEDACVDGWFPQAVGITAADASTLLVPASGLLPSDHPSVVRTMEMVGQSLGRGNGLLRRYLADDGLAGGEGAFLLCSFWLLDVLTHAGRLDEAETLLEHLLGLANDVGLYAEEVDPDTGEHLGNFPQAFSHMALVLSAAHLSAAKRGQIPEGPASYAELALHRLMAKLATVEG
jgi:GH15 family glucan-1,4-alpha-glucosidase